MDFNDYLIKYFNIYYHGSGQKQEELRKERTKEEG